MCKISNPSLLKILCLLFDFKAITNLKIARNKLTYLLKISFWRSTKVYSISININFSEKEMKESDYEKIISSM